MNRLNTLARFAALTPLLSALLLSEVAKATEPAPAASAPAFTASEAAMSVADLDRLIAPIFVGTSYEQRKASAKIVMDLGPDATEAVAKKLADLRKVPTNIFWMGLKAGRDAGKAAGDNTDLLENLFRVDNSETPGFKPALTTVLLMHTLVHIGTTPAARLLIRVLPDHDNYLKPETAKQIQLMGERAIPALIEARKEPSGEIKRFSTAALEAMGKRTPGEAVQMKDNVLLADTLRAYALVHDNDAIAVILSFVNSDRVQVRTAAREALVPYGQDAVWKVREAYSNLTGKSAPDGWNAAETAKQLFAEYDRFRLQEVYALLEDGMKAQKDGKVDDAVAAFDKVLARQPMIDRRAEMVPAYLAKAEALEDKEPAVALGIYRKAARLDPEGPKAAHVGSAIATLEGKELLTRGIADIEPFERALKLDPDNKKARAELDRLEFDAETRQSRTRRIAAGLAILLMAVYGIFYLTGQKKKDVKKSANSAPPGTKRERRSE